MANLNTQIYIMPIRQSRLRGASSRRDDFWVFLQMSRWTDLFWSSV